MKIGILTHYNVNNQGAQLQMLAMKYYLEEMGHQVCILSYEKNFDFDKAEAKKNSMSLRNFPYYIKNYMFDKGIALTLFNTRKALVHKKSRENLDFQPYDQNDCDAVIIGSDEVFSIDVGCNKMMYGYGLGKTPAIAYAPAFGRTTEELLKKYHCYDLVKKGLSSMYALSARDQHTREMIFRMTGRDVPMVSDPVLLYRGRKFYVPVRKIRKRYLLVYAYDRNMTDKEEIRNIRYYAKKHGLVTVSLGTYHKWCDRNIVCDARQWYSYFKYAECVVTDTFHGTVVAVRNHCNVAVFIRESINAFKLESLLRETGLVNRRLKRLTIKNLEHVLSQPIDYDVVDQRIEDSLEVSRKYLKEALEKIG